MMNDIFYILSWFLIVAGTGSFISFGFLAWNVKGKSQDEWIAFIAVLMFFATVAILPALYLIK